MNGPQFVLFGTPVRVEPIFFLVVAYFGLSAGSIALMAAWVVVVFVGILVHELGHALAFRRFGSGSQIVLWGFGGLTTGTSQPPRRSIAVSLAGPLTGFVLLGIPALVLARSGAVTDPTLLRIVDMAVFVNVGWSAINLLPVLPLDGGNITKDVLQLVTGRPSERTARYISIVTAVAAGAFVWVWWEGQWLFPVLLAGLLAFLNVASLRRGTSDDFIHIDNAPAKKSSTTRSSRGGAPGVVDPPMAGPTAPEQLNAGYEALGRGDADAALAAARGALEAHPYADVQLLAVELQSWACLRLRQLDDARAALGDLPRGRKASRYLRAALDAAASVDQHGVGATASPAASAGLGVPAEPDPEGPLGALVHAFLFGGDTPARDPAAGFLADWGLTEPVARGLLAAGPDGAAEVERLEGTFGRLGRDGDAAAVRRLRPGGAGG